MRRGLVGSDEHKRLFCDSFIATHEPYSPDSVELPEIDAEARRRLGSLPIWDEAASTERETAKKVQCMAPVEKDPLISEAIALQGFEEGRHAQLLNRLTARYGIPVTLRPEKLPPPNPAWEFTRTEYGECFDAFFAFGLFRLAADSGFFPAALVKLFDPVMQEEARHVLFFVNWMAYHRARVSPLGRAWLDFKRGVAVALAIFSRIRTAVNLGESEQDNFSMSSHNSFGEFSLRAFLDTCVRENDRRLGLYDSRLLRPQFVPRMVKLALKVLPS